MMKSTSVALLAVAVATVTGNARAQSTDSTAKQPSAVVDPRDSLFLRARKLVLAGNGPAGRALVDSALTASDGTPDYPTALYWRGALASTAADAERDYRRVIVEYPFSPHSGDALLALAQLEMARGDRDPAIAHLQRFLLQWPNDPERVRAGISLGRLLLDQNQLAKGCAVLLRTRATLGDTALETRNQVDYYAGRCVGVDTVVPVARSAASARATRADTTQRRPPPPPRDTLRTDTTRRPVTTKDTARRSSPAPNGGPKSPTGRYTVQVAAYATKDSAESLVTKLGARGIVARVATSAKPFRVRIGHYATDTEATTAARE
ncbi:MAG TPA: SPOR domain-containing protein, partial [Gemmatimonadaceae bacterium]|nr:SPOR domain-containing protein [Gemmatimonadaceae bacterium]